MINKFLAGLSEQGKLLLVVALIIVIVALFDRLLIAPTMSRLSTIDEETAKEEESIRGDLHFLGYKNKIMKESQTIDPFLSDSIPTENDVNTDLLKKIEMIASKANVTLSKEATAGSQQEANYIKYSADFECTGNLTDVVTFMHLINTSKELTKVVKFNLGSKKADSDEIKATMTVAKVIISRKTLAKPTISATTGKAQADASNVQKN